MICITSYNRPAMLLRLLNELQGCGHRVCVFDDASTYDPAEHRELCEYNRISYHRGKVHYWKQWQWIFDRCRASDDERFIFMPDDWHSIELDRINEWFNRLEGKYAFNVTNNGVKTNWTSIERKKIRIDGKPVYRVGFVDCGFFTTRLTLEALDWHIEPVDLMRFRIPNISSGVGQQLSNRLMGKFIPMYQPVRSMAWHDGTHESQMHPKERERNPLIPR